MLGLAPQNPAAAKPAKPANAAKAAKPAPPAKPRQLLFFTKSSGFEHSAIRVKDGQMSVAERVLRELGEEHGFAITHTKDGSVFTPENLAKYDAFLFFTTGNLTQPGKDKMPPMTEAGRDAFYEAIKQGKGYVGFHAASDTLHSPGDRFVNNGDDADPYIKLIGGEFIRHGKQQKAKVLCVDSKFPGLGDCKDSFELLEEWYSFKNLSKDNHVLLALATWTLNNTGPGNSVYRRAPYPVTWTRMHGKGRVFYTALGHREDVWTNPRFQNLIVGGIQWATGDANATVKPNIAQVTPGYDELPPNDPPTVPPSKAAAAPAVAAPGSLLTNQAPSGDLRR